MSPDLAIETADLTKVYSTRWKRRLIRAVDGISLQVPRGATFGLLGPNGAGKTTFVKMLLSVVHPTSGTAASSCVAALKRSPPMAMGTRAPRM